MVRDNSQRLDIPQAVERTVVTFIERNGLLSGFLKSHRAEVVDVCITEYKEELHLRNVHAEGRAEGRAEMLFSLVADGDITLERAAEKAELGLVEFKRMYDQSPYGNNR